MKVEVEMLAFGNGDIRIVSLDDSVKNMEVEEQLDQVFMFGQNDAQPLNMPSVSMGDVIRLNGERFKIAMFGFEKIK